MRFQSISTPLKSGDSEGAELNVPPPPDLRTAPLLMVKKWMRLNCIPLESPLRDSLWLELSQRSGSNAPEDFPEDVLDTLKLPTFVDLKVARFFRLNQRGREEVNSVLWHLQQSCPQITSAPLLYPLSALFLHFSQPKDVFRSLYNLVNSRDTRFLAISRADRSRDAIILLKLTKKLSVFSRIRCAEEALHKLKNNALDIAFAQYLQWILSLPFDHVVRIVDCFLIEGEKFLFRVTLALALLFEKHESRDAFSLERMRNFCESLDKHVTSQQLIELSLKSFKRLSKKHISKARAKARALHVDSEHVTLVGTDSPPTQKDLARDLHLGTRLAPRTFTCQSVEWKGLDLLWEWLPERVVVREPLVVFSTLDNGHSLQTLFSLSSDFEETVLLIQTIGTDKQVFGAFCSQSWSLRHSGDSAHFGTGETFLFRLEPRPHKFEWVGKGGARVAHAQQLFQSASGSGLCVGSGGGKFGLFVDESLTRGRSERCETFENESLSKEVDFDIAILEVIAFC